MSPLETVGGCVDATPRRADEAAAALIGEPAVGWRPAMAARTDNSCCPAASQACGTARSESEDDCADTLLTLSLSMDRRGFLGSPVVPS
eukprot:scaffold229278_cov31-Prasinocladus_malaysianus.AAC.2